MAVDYRWRGNRCQPSNLGRQLETCDRVRGRAHNQPDGGGRRL